MKRETELSSDRVQVVLDFVKGLKEFKLESLSQALGIPEATLASTLEEMKQNGIIDFSVKEEESYELTERGAKYKAEGLPETRLASILREKGALSVEKVKEELGDEANAAISWAIKKGYAFLKKEDGKTTIYFRKASDENLDDLISANRAEALQRGMIRKKTVKTYLLVSAKAVEQQRLPVLTRLTHDEIISGRWKQGLKPYDLSALPQPSRGGKKNFFEEFLSWVRETLEDMGFQESLGPYVELEFWNFDALFQAQDHPAREMHDVLYVEGKGKIEDEDLIRRVAREHELGWGYSWSLEKASSLVLRSQNTAVSARFLAEHKERPIKMYSVDRVFRKDEIDQKHHIEFYQSEGIVVDKNLSLADLIGFLTQFARQLGFDEVRFYPSYFPFTEPSVEGYVKHPVLGWMEALPGGVFRPEVTRPLGTDEPVLAWGIGISRLAMAKFGLNDIRLLYSPDVDFLMEEEL
ncbi:phenylalanine--tRNA ligase subunit alpha [Tardisphaera miroshnichenkoae]